MRLSSLPPKRHGNGSWGSLRACIPTSYRIVTTEQAVSDLPLVGAYLRCWPGKSEVTYTASEVDRAGFVCIFVLDWRRCCPATTRRFHRDCRPLLSHSGSLAIPSWLGPERSANTRRTTGATRAQPFTHRGDSHGNTARTWGRARPRASSRRSGVSVHCSHCPTSRRIGTVSLAGFRNSIAPAFTRNDLHTLLDSEQVMNTEQAPLKLPLRPAGLPYAELYSTAAHCPQSTIPPSPVTGEAPWHGRTG